MARQIKSFSQVIVAGSVLGLSLMMVPEGLVVVGDAACAFNPVYGQGMTTSALGTVTLDQCLSEQRCCRPYGDLIGLARRFQKQLAKVNAVPWMLATSEDYRYRGTEGESPDLATRLMHRYMDRVVLLSTKNANVRLVLLEVMHMLKQPTALFHPKIIAQVLRQALESTFSLPERVSPKEGVRQATL